jgi:hypothetical protein
MEPGLVAVHQNAIHVEQYGADGRSYRSIRKDVARVGGGLPAQGSPAFFSEIRKRS